MTSFSIVVPTEYGQMIVNRFDINQANALIKTGKAIDHDEIMVLMGLLRQRPANAVVVDAGANFGTYALASAAVVGPLGRVHAFEPQRLIYNMLCGSVALNALTNVICHNVALGDQTGLIECPQFDYFKPMNFGSVEFGDRQNEPLGQMRRYEKTSAETVGLTTLDRFNFERLDLLKVDIEGMEMKFLDGAKNTILKCRPIIHIEYLKVDAKRLGERLVSLGYNIYHNEMNYTCIPSEISSVIAR